jgi:hypothetical protein
VIGIIALLIGILIPVIHKVQISGRIADTKNWLVQISSAVERYHSDFRAFPGPISNLDVYNNTNPNKVQAVNPTPTGYDVTGFDQAKITMSENLFLGLVGGLKNVAAAGANPDIRYDPSTIGLGPASLNANNPKRYSPYMDATNTSMRDDAGLKTGHFKDDAGDADDTVIPEFVDRFTDPMPILYMRSKLGVDVNISPTAANNSVITDNSTPTARLGPYDISQIIGYTQSFSGTWPTLTADAAFPPAAASRSIGVKKMPAIFQKGSAKSASGASFHGLRTVDPTAVMDKTSTTAYQYPYDAFPYFQNPNTPNIPRQKDGYILISAGPDRIYGTNDDICNFGDVVP